jgi:adenylate kinase
MTPKRHHVVVTGAPGAGKGTQAAQLAERLGAAHLEVGALFRQLAAGQSPLGAQVRELIATGSLVPDDVTDEVVSGRLRALPPDQGFVLDGYPRNVRQARALQRLLAELGRLEPRPVFVRLDVPRDVLIARLRRRRDLEDRGDDTDEVIARRLEIYEAETAPVRDVVSEWADVVTIDGDRSPEAVTDEIAAVLRRREGGASVAPSRTAPSSTHN